MDLRFIMAFFQNRFTSSKQDWTTPKSLFTPLNNEFNFTLDAAASNNNALVSVFLSESDDALKCNWGTNVVWINPPYGGTSKLSTWIKKAYQSSLEGALVVMLIPARTNTIWFHEYCLKYGEVRFIKGRPKFGDAIHGLPQPLCIVIFRPLQGDHQ
jgi:phage N-6-adenine-methyltransferase